MKNVIVGVDGSDASAAALRWAVETVGHDGRIHAVVSINPWTELLADAVSSHLVPYGESVENDLIHRWTVDAGFAVGTLSSTVSYRPVAVALDRAATIDEADAIVVGAHHAVGGIAKRIGHATNRLIRETTHPVIIVPTEGEAVPLRGGTVAVGIGHGDATRSAVRWVAHLAQSLSISVELVHAGGDAPAFQADGPLDLVRYESGNVDQTRWERGEIDHFAELLRTLAGPDLELTVTTPPGLAALRLDEASERCALLVLGRHRSRLDGGHHTSQPLRHVLTHAACPIAVIADRPDDEIAPG